MVVNKFLADNDVWCDTGTKVPEKNSKLSL